MQPAAPVRQTARHPEQTRCAMNAAADFPDFPSSGVRPADRLGFTLFLAAVLHVAFILGVGFTFADPSQISKTLEVTLATFKSDKKPEKADYLAQMNQQGSGTLEHKDTPKTTEQAPFQDQEIKKVTPPAAPQQAARQEAPRPPSPPPRPRCRRPRSSTRKPSPSPRRARRRYSTAPSCPRRSPASRPSCPRSASSMPSARASTASTRPRPCVTRGLVQGRLAQEDRTRRQPQLPRGSPSPATLRQPAPAGVDQPRRHPL